MATYNGRRAPNVSAYLANLNMPSPTDLAPAPLALDDSLDFLTNTEFFDFDYTPAAGAIAPTDAAAYESHRDVAEAPNFADFHFAGGYPNLTSPGTLPPTPPNGLAAAAYGAFPDASRSASATLLPASADLEDVSRVAAEEDKRRRNTAASARFRVKKKQREQALEKAAKDMTSKVSALESRVQQLETENKWLKELLTAKSAKTPEAEGRDDDKVAKREAADRKTGKHTVGVGTEVEV